MDARRLAEDAARSLGGEAAGDEEEDDEDDDDDADDDEEEDDYYGDGDAVDEAPGEEARSRGRRDVVNNCGGASAAGSARAPRSCWPPTSPRQAWERAPIWAPLFRVSAVNHPLPQPPPPPPMVQPPEQPPSGAPRQPRQPRGPAAPAQVPRPVPVVREGNPIYGNRMKLFCRTGYHLIIGPKGRVTGTSNRNDKYAVMEFSSVSNGEVRIRGVEANLFLAMNREGKLYGQANVRQEGTVFVEMLLGQYNTYLSRKFAHAGWYVGIKKNGKQKLGHKTAWGQKAIQFLPVRIT